MDVLNKYGAGDRVTFLYQGHIHHASIIEPSVLSDRYHLRVDGWISTEWVKSKDLTFERRRPI